MLTTQNCIFLVDFMINLATTKVPKRWLISPILKGLRPNGIRYTGGIVPLTLAPWRTSSLSTNQAHIAKK